VSRCSRACANISSETCWNLSVRWASKCNALGSKPKLQIERKDHFLATLSHELRTPLNAISDWTYLMRNSSKDETLVAQGLDVLQRNTNLLIEIISDLLDTSRIGRAL
jgi:signal transduction histidine kinase